MRRLISGARITCRLLIMVWIVYLFPAAWVEAGASLELKISLPKDSIIQREPIFAKLELKNVGDEDITLSIEELKYSGVAIYIALQDEQQKAYYLGNGLGQSINVWGDSIKLGPGESLTHCEMLLYNARTPGYTFDKADRYRIWAVYRGSVRSNEITLDVGEAIGINAKALELIKNHEYPSISSKGYSPHDFGQSEDISAEALAELVRDYEIANFIYYGGTRHQELVDAFTKLVKSYPRSVYTRYALFSLWKVYAGEEYPSHKIKKDHSRGIPYLEKLVNEFPPNEQTEDVLWILIEAHGETRNLAKVRSYLLEFKKRFPKSPRIASVNEGLEEID